MKQEFKAPVDQVAGRDVINIIHNPVHQVMPGDWDCPHCGTTIKRGNTVCRGCHADIVYGSTKKERRDNFWGGAVVIGLAMIPALLALPGYLNETLDYSISDVWGLPIYAIAPIVIVAGLVAGIINASIQNARRRTQPPRFIRAKKYD